MAFVISGLPARFETRNTFMNGSQSDRLGRNFAVWVLIAAMITPTLGLAQEKPRFKPGFNLYSPTQDVEIGKAGVAEIEKEVQVLKDPEVERYVSQLGHRLVGYAPGNKEYPWTFKVVNSQDINAFALPGGFIYVNRGVLEAADNEAQAAGVIAHEIGHVVMRHGTHRASQAQVAQLPLAVLGGVFGQSGSATAQLAQLGIGFGLNSILLKNSRGAESQSDDIGTYMLHEAGYDPHAMAQFFDIIGKKYPQRTVQFFSDHPNPENRVKRVNKVIAQLGPAKQTRSDSPEFQVTKKRLLGLPAPPKAQPAGQPAPAKAVGAPAPPSSRHVRLQGDGFSITHPENWDVQRGKDSVTIAPAGGVFSNAQGHWEQAYGASITRLPRQQGRGLEAATGDLIKSWQQSNPSMRVLQQKKGKVRGRRALSTTLENDSPLAGQMETDILVTVEGREEILAVIFVSPQSDYGSYRPTFDAMLKSFEVQ
jgi:Zn-dependent protease with chaperone function